MRIIHLLSLLRLLRLIDLFRMAKLLRANGFVYLIILLTVSITFGAIGMFVVEGPNPKSSIKNLGDALWFSFTTITISGFGDVVPITVEGRMIAVVLIVIGLTTILGFISSFGATIITTKIKTECNYT